MKWLLKDKSLMTPLTFLVSCDFVGSDRRRLSFSASIYSYIHAVWLQFRTHMAPKSTETSGEQGTVRSLKMSIRVADGHNDRLTKQRDEQRGSMRACVPPNNWLASSDHFAVSLLS